MKNIFKLLLLFVIVTSCNIENDDKTTSDDVSVKQNSRIKEVETIIINGYRVTIIKVDETEFLLNSDGGIIAL